MALISCPECKKEFSDRSNFCSYCGIHLNKITNNVVEEDTDVVGEDNTKKRKVSNYLKSISIVFICLGFIFIGMGFYKKNVYEYYTEYTQNINKNAYVGGDAYNYIINGAYFTGYSVLGVGSLIIASILSTQAIVIDVLGTSGSEEEKNNDM